MVYCTLLLAKVKFSTALIHQFNTFAIKSARLVNNYSQVRNFRFPFEKLLCFLLRKKRNFANAFAALNSQSKNYLRVK